MTGAVPISITREAPDSPDAAALIGELDGILGALYAAESRHGYSVERLIREGVHFFVLRCNGVPAGCGGIQFYDGFGELKRMYVRPAFRGRGLGRAMFDHLERRGRAEGCSLLRLETGVHQHEAIALYERAGFRRIAPFPPYRPDPVSLCYEKQLAG
ncbi:MAG: GNAT family N-acetyltransferase [Rhodospirillaceae bacterium]|nr:GNAT family N-acetyltransferase [Rhodospirillaceae bacterium]